MILEIVKYGHPVLRQKGAAIEKITPEIKKLIADMFETMHERHGVGLAGATNRTARCNSRSLTCARHKDRPSTLELKGKPADVDVIMPLVLINPEIKPVGEPATGGEGCLSFPEIFAEISRPGFVDVKALNEKFKPIEFRAGGLLSRAIQHEMDHLNGILFIDRMEQKDEGRISRGTRRAANGDEGGVGIGAQKKVIQ